MNPQLRVHAYEERVGEESSAFDEGFWRSLDGVANALDNVQARLFVDQCCVAYGIPLLESGTSGRLASGTGGRRAVPEVYVARRKS